MQVKKAGGKVFGLHLSAAERKAMNLEIQRQLADYDRKHMTEMDAVILWVLHEQFGFGPKRLKRFYDNFSISLEALLKRYELDSDDKVWLCTNQLKKCGIDLEEWEKGTSDVRQEKFRGVF